MDAFFLESLISWDFGIMEAQDFVRDVKAGNLPGYKTGISTLDNFIRFMRREYCVLAGRAGTGKTAIMMQLAESVATQMVERKRKGIIAIFSAEMDSRTLALRAACGLEGVSLWNLQTGNVAQSDCDRVIERLQMMMGGVFRVDQSSAPTLEHMQQQLSIYAEDGLPIELVIVDYVELVGEIDKAENLRIAKISRGMKALAKTFDTTTIGIVQMNRDIETRTKKVPLLRDLMQGGEREPDRVVMLVREGLYEEDGETSTTCAYVTKNRNGPLGMATMVFDEANMRFKPGQMVDGLSDIDS